MPRVGRAATWLGIAGLLPAFAAACLIALGQVWASVIALLYPAAILSFLGGIWWGFAMRRATGQARLAALAIVPSIAGVALVCGAIAAALLTSDPSLSDPWPCWMLVALGASVLLTLPVDRHLERTGEAPAGWLRLRLPLSVGLGGLTIVSAVLMSLQN